jgi:hypothetical protein
MWKTKWGSCWLTFDEDDDDHRWERVELQYPTATPYSVQRWGSTRGNREGKALGGHPQADILGDRGEWDEDNSGRGQVYVGAWDGKLHLFGAESGVWTVDEHAKYWGSHPVLGNSSPENAKKVDEIVQYRDTNANGFFDEITYDYDGDEKVDLKINLLELGGDERPLHKPGELKWKGMHELLGKIAAESFQDGLKIFRAAWKRGLTNAEIDDDAIASSTCEKYDHGYWVKEKVFRLVDQRLARSGDGKMRARLHRAYFTGDVDGLVKVIQEMP